MGNKALPKVEIAFRIASRFPTREPKAQELMDEFGLSETKAYEFKRAMRKARCLTPPTVTNNVLGGVL